jgi:hypothetical protein
MNKRPLSVTIIACVYIAVGAMGFAYHLKEFSASHAFQNDFIAIELIRLVAIVCGVFLLRGRNWARWLALAWIAFHVILSAFHAWSQLAIHSLFCAVIAWLLFRPESARYFRAAETRTA